MPTAITKTVGTGKDYATLALWHSNNGGATSGDLVTNDENVIANIFNFVETSHIYISNFTTDATRNILIQTDSSAKHNGTYGTSSFRIELGNTFGGIFDVSDAYCTIDGVLFKNTSTTGSTQDGARLNTGNITFRNCIFLWGGNNPGKAIAHSGATDGCVIENCLAYGGWAYGYYTNASSTGGIKVTNSTAEGMTADGFFSFSGKTLWTNCIGINCTGRSFSSSPDAASDYNAGDDTYEYGTNSFAITEGTPTDIFTSVGSDYHLASSASCIGQGIGPTSDANVPTTDIDGDTRSGTTCDPGFDEYVAAGLGGTLNMAILHHHRQREGFI